MPDEGPHATRRQLQILGPARTTTTRFTPAVLRAIAEDEARALEGLLRRGPEGAIVAVEEVNSHVDQMIASAMEQEPPEAPIACEKGCSTCCQAKVLVVAPEVLRIAAFLRNTLSDEDLAALKQRVAETDATTFGLTRVARAEAHVSCPLLDAEGGCGVHAVRPLVCRSWTSYDAAACETYWQDPSKDLTPPQWAQGYELTQAALAGLGKACLDAGREGRPLEFVRALLIALERPNAGKRWHDKLPVFSTAVDAEWAEVNGA